MEAYQGFLFTYGQFVGAGLGLTVDLPSGFGDLSLSGYDFTVANDGYQEQPRTCSITVFSGASAYQYSPCDAPYYGSSTLTLIFPHAVGIPLSFAINFQGSVQSPNSTYSDNFNFVLSNATPEPNSAWLLLPGLLGIAALRKRGRSSKARFGF